ncbi:hypothetical protein N7492_003019 [Penicillium capsulatum]|uniref:DUF7770 domain-containing protein n=1 Tax=Penicillium capsulatum TaxID=69766 RepID=A0A9W9IL60_9EURO|nr:hypothetical protein N7492_003019 [Penicillium capsulatum]
MSLRSPPFQPVQFIPSALKETILSRTVSLLYAVAHETLSEGGNHWCLYLQVGPDESVCIDITPSYNIPGPKIPGESKAYMIMSLVPYLYLPSAQKAVGLQVRTGIQVQDFVDLLIQENRHRYEFDANG